MSRSAFHAARGAPSLSPDGIRLLNHRFSEPGISQFLVTSLPEVSPCRIVQRVKAFFKGKREINDIDGMRVKFEHGWGLLRASNTQPVLVMRFEAETPGQLAAYRKEVEDALEACR